MTATSGVELRRPARTAARRRGPDRVTGRFDRSARAVLWCAVLFLAALASVEAYRFALPTDGWSLVPPVEAPVFAEDLLGLPGALEPGDRLVAVDGVPFPVLVVEAIGLRRTDLRYAPGDVVTYTVSRAGEDVDVAVTVGRWNAAGVARALWRTLALTHVGGVYRWLAWLLAAYVFLSRPAVRSAQLLFLLESVVLGAAITGTVAQVSIADALSPALFYEARFTGDLFTWLLAPPLALHVVLAFPGSRPVGRAWLGLTYAVPWLVLVAVWVWGAASLVPAMTSTYSLLTLAAVVRLVVLHGAGANAASVRWFAFAYGLSNLASALFWLGTTGLLPAPHWLHSLLLDQCLCDVLYVAGFAVAVLWHGLFDVDAVIGRTLVYGGLTLAVVGVYAAVVGGAGRLLAGGSSLPLSLAATALVAFLFDPLRSRLQRASNRLLYGLRDEPHELLARLGEGLVSAPQLSAALGEVTRAVAETLRLPFASVRLGNVTASSYGEPRRPREVFPLRHAGAVLGELEVSPRQAEGRLSRADRRLLGALAAQVGTVAHALLLEADLERERLFGVNAREADRRRLGSDLHDDVGHRLVWLMRRAQEAAALVDTDPAAAKAALASIGEEARATMSRVRSLAHLLHPPELAVLGLAGAVGERLEALGAAGPRCHLDAEDLGDVPAAVELAAYHIVTEALSNVVKHAAARACRVRLAVVEAPPGAGLSVLTGRCLLVEVCDDGVGTGVGGAGPSGSGAGARAGAVAGGDLGAAPRPGLGLRSMQVRAREVGGVLTVESPAGGGTVVRALLPWPE